MLLSAAGVAALVLGTGAPAMAADPVPDGWNWQVMATIPTGGVTGFVTVNPTTHTVYMATSSGIGIPETFSIGVVDGLTGAVVTTIDQGIGMAPSYPAVNRATNKIYFPADGSSEINVVDGATNELTTTIAVPNSSPYGAAVDEATNTIYVSDGNDRHLRADGALYIVDGATDTVTDTIPLPNDVDRPVLDPTVGKLYIPHGTEVIVFDTVSKTLLPAIPVAHANAFGDAVVDPSRNRVYVLDQPGNAVFTIDTTTDQVVGAPIPVGTAANGLWGIAIDTVTNRLFVASNQSPADPWIYVIDPGTGATATVSLPSLVSRDLSGIDVDESTGTVYVNTFEEGARVSFLNSVQLIREVGPTQEETDLGATDPGADATSADAGATGSGAPALAATGADPVPGIVLAGVLLLGGASLIVLRRVRRRQS